MRSRLMLAIMVCLIAALASLAELQVAPEASAQKLPANEPYSLSYAAGSYDANGSFLGGTELMNLVAFKGALYAGIGYWMDRQSAWRDPKPGAQVIVLDTKFSQWRQDFKSSVRATAQEYTRVSAMERIEFHRFDDVGHVSGLLAEMLVVGLDGPAGGAVYTQRSPGNWEDTRIPANASIRSLSLHYDSLDRVEKLYVAGGAQLYAPHEGNIYSGVYDAVAPGRIRWDPRPEPVKFQNRVMSMVDCGGVLFAAAKPSIYRRNDQKRQWELVYSHPRQYSFDETKYASGFRALTCINATGSTGGALLASFEGISGEIVKIDLQTGVATVELQSREFLTQQWGYPPAKPDIIIGYNDIPLVKDDPETRLFGLLAISPKPAEHNSAWLLSRTNNNMLGYQLHEVRPPSWPNRRSDGALWSVRAIAISPFPDDQNKIVYLGGYDGHFAPDHNTAWLYRVGVNVALEPYNRRKW
jgi:hypothetical protein